MGDQNTNTLVVKRWKIDINQLGEAYPNGKEEERKQSE
jgi:hypothetical protein